MFRAAVVHILFRIMHHLHHCFSRKRCPMRYRAVIQPKAIIGSCCGGPLLWGTTTRTATRQRRLSTTTTTRNYAAGRTTVTIATTSRRTFITGKDVGDDPTIRSPLSLWNIHPPVAEALHQGRPVVALESTIVAHGMPYPQNWQLAQDVENLLRSKGVEPATIGMYVTL
jgi:Indigoidine synthase A like protein